MKTPLIKTRLSKTLRKEDGQALIITLISFTVLLGFFGLAVDVGYMFYTKRQLQVAADAAALAGASVLTAGTPTLSLITAAANYDAALNGITTGVTVTWPYTPQSLCANCTSNNFVEVVVSQTKQTGFMSFFGSNPTTVAARAVAFAQNSPGCMFTLNQNGGQSPSGMFLNGNGIFINAPTCAIYIDSPSNSTGNTAGLYVAPSFCAELMAKSIGIVGKPGYSNGSWCFGNGISPTPAGGIVPVADPLAYLPQGTQGACLPSHTAVSCTTVLVGATPTPQCQALGTSPPTALNTTTLSPGNYCACQTSTGTSCTAGAAAISVKTTGITFNPGTYNLNGETYATGGLNIAAGSTNLTYAGVTGTGVTFYMWNGATFSVSGPGSIFSSNGITLTAPGPGGQYPGILFYQDRADNGTAVLGGDFGKLDLEGAIYVPDGNLTFPAVIQVTTLQNNTILVANTIQWSGFLGLFQDYDKATGSGGISPIKTVVLTE
jgi:Flp pilus assembly protein TadG